MKQSGRARLLEGQANEGEGRDGHDSCNGPVPVGATDCEMVVGGDSVGEAIDVERIVASALFKGRETHRAD